MMMNSLLVPPINVWMSERGPELFGSLIHVQFTVSQLVLPLPFEMNDSTLPSISSSSSNIFLAQLLVETLTSPPFLLRRVFSPKRTTSESDFRFLIIFRRVRARERSSNFKRSSIPVHFAKKSSTC